MIKIAIDAMGGDEGLSVTVPGALEVLTRHGDNLHLILVGQQDLINQTLHQCGGTNHPHITVHHASEVVAMDERPSVALRTMKDSSMRVAINLVKEGAADACVSAGNTGALMATSRFVLKNVAWYQSASHCLRHAMCNRGRQ